MKFIVQNEKNDMFQINDISINEPSPIFSRKPIDWQEKYHLIVNLIEAQQYSDMLFVHEFLS